MLTKLWFLEGKLRLHLPVLALGTTWKQELYIFQLFIWNIALAGTRV